MSATTVDDAGALRAVLEPWKAAVDAHEPEAVAAVFTEGAIFQGLHPYSVGRRGVGRVLRRAAVGHARRVQRPAVDHHQVSRLAQLHAQRTDGRFAYRG